MTASVMNSAPFVSTLVDSFVSSICNSLDLRDAYWRRMKQEADEENKRAHAEKMRRRNLGYLWKRPILKRLQILLRYPLVLFLPCWSARRWRSLT